MSVTKSTGPFRRAILAAISAFCVSAGADVTVDGSAVFQRIDGFGVNANCRSWSGDELKPVLDAFLDSGMGLFRVVIDNADWEKPNDNADPAVMNQAAYKALYEKGDFPKLWQMLAYLNQKGVSNGIVLNVMGPGPNWMGGGTLAAGREEEWAEMMASMLIYARRTKKLHFRLVAPDNEADIQNEGIHMDPAVYARCLRKLARKLDEAGLADIRFVGPDLAGNDPAYHEAMAADSAILARLAHWGVHSYGPGAGIIQDPDRSCWVTEYNVWAPGADSGTRGTYDWAYCRGTAEYLLSHLANGASAGFVWEGYDSFYRHPPSTWSFWGLFSVDDETAATKTYTPRMNFRTVSQISRSVAPGSRRIGVTGNADSVSPLLAFYHTASGRLTLAGIQEAGQPSRLEGRLVNLPDVNELTLSVTTASGGPSIAGVVPVTGGVFSVQVPADCVFTLAGQASTVTSERLCGHPVRVDAQGRLLPWSLPASRAFDRYLTKGWEWALAAPLDRNGLPISFLYCAWNPGDPPSASESWENDIGEKFPNWVESARLFYQYSGNRAPLDQVRQMADYILAHGLTPADHAWPRFPVGTANAGDTDFTGFTGAWAKWDCHVDLAADMGWAFHTLYRLTGSPAYRDAAVRVADLLAARQATGTAEISPWPYVVNSKTGTVRSRYAASWDGALRLFDGLVADGLGRPEVYRAARVSLKRWLLAFPMKNGAWVDGHSDVRIDGTNNLSATCAADMALYLLEHPKWDPDFTNDAPALLRWLEENFVDVATPDGLPGWFHGAAVPAEQTAYMYRMGYQAARMGALYALWYAASGETAFKDKAYRCLVYDTYMMQKNGQSADGPTGGVGYWWSDCYGEAPRMYYYGLASVPEWAPADENHMVGSSDWIRSISYGTNAIVYETVESSGVETFRLAQAPTRVEAAGKTLPRLLTLDRPGWVYRGGAGVLRIRREGSARVRVELEAGPVPPVEPPAAVPPILGSAAEGTFADTLWDGGPWINAGRFQARSNGTVRVIRAKVGAIDGRYAAAVYADTNGLPGRLVRRTGEIRPAASGWRSLPLESPLLLKAGRFYWLAIWSDDPNARVHAENGGLTGWGRYDFGAWPDPLGITGNGAYRYSIYAAPGL